MFVFPFIDLHWFSVLLKCTIKLNLDLPRKVLAITFHSVIEILTVLPIITRNFHHADHNSEFPPQKACNVKHNYGIICLSEIYLGSSIQYDHKILSKLIQTRYPAGTQYSGNVCWLFRQRSNVPESTKYLRNIFKENIF